MQGTIAFLPPIPSRKAKELTYNDLRTDTYPEQIMSGDVGRS